jgi:N-sulfoglucosamine sulfohydrolase
VQIQRPNVLYIHSHDTGRCMSPYGFPVSMPSYQRLADSGVVFRRAFSASPTCSPSRAGLLTGQSPHSTGMLGLAHRGFSLHTPGQHLASYLFENGYHSILAGHQHLTASDPHDLGYQTVLEPISDSASSVAPGAASFLREMARSVDKPFFLDVGFEEAHRPFHDAPGDAGNYVSTLPGVADTRENREDTARFHASLRELDKGVGAVLSALDDSGLAENTIVVLTTDHGPPFPGMKATLTDAGIGVGLIVRHPGSIGRGIVTDALVSQLDVFPTICELVGIDPPDWLQGTSLVPILQGSATRVRSEIFAEMTFHAAYEPQRAIRTNRWTYIRRFDEWSLPVLPNIDASPQLDFMLSHGFDRRPIPKVLLFDNALDPLQRVNLAGSQELQDIERNLAGRLEEWMWATDDPLVNGPISLPPGAMVNKVADRSPEDPLVRRDFR